MKSSEDEDTEGVKLKSPTADSSKSTFNKLSEIKA